MHSIHFLWVQTLFLLNFCGPAFSSRVPLARKFEKKDVCVEDDVLESYQVYPQDSIPFCSYWLDITDTTSTITPSTSRTTTITTTTTEAEYSQTITVPLFTEFSTTTTVVGLNKRAPAPTAAPKLLSKRAQLLVLRDTPNKNASVISAVSSACSCLHITPNIDYVTATGYYTRTETAIDYQSSIDYETITAGTTTVLVTQSLEAIPTASKSLWNITTTPTSPLSTGASSSDIPTISMTVSSTTISVIPVPVQNSTRISSTSVPSSATFPSSGVVPTSVVIQNTTSLPLSTTAPPTTSPSPVISGSPILTFTNTSSSVSGFPTVISLNVTSTATSSSPISTATSCPSINNTIITIPIDGSQFLVQCYKDYGGSIDVGLSEPNFYDCLQECAIANAGFSANRCRGASYYPNTDGANCFLKNSANLLLPGVDPLAVSGILINVPDSSSNSTTNSTTNATTTSAPISSPSSGYPTFGNDTRTAVPTSKPSSTINSSFMSNITYPIGPTGTNPTIPVMTSIPTPSKPISNTTYPAGPTGTNPSISITTSASYNWSMSSFNATPTAGPTVKQSTVKTWASASITPSISINSTTFPSMTPSPSFNMTRLPSLTPTASYNSSTGDRTVTLFNSNTTCPLTTQVITNYVFSTSTVIETSILYAYATSSIP